MKSTHPWTKGGARAPLSATRSLCGPLSLSLFLALSSVTAVVGCGSDDDVPPGTDGGHRDATVVDGGPEVDGAVASDGGAGADASTDAGFVGCTREACDPVDPACADAGMCVLAGAVPECVAATMIGSRMRGESCDVTADCGAGLACVMRRGGAICAELCCPDGSSACSEATERCAGIGTLADGTATDWWTCVGPRACNVLEGDSVCDPGEACYITSSMGETDCRRAGTLDVGDACAAQEDCGPGLFCLVGASMPTCARICEIGASTGPRTCPMSEGTCIAYSYSPAGTGICTKTMM